jgi:PKD repeat protein
MSRLFSLILLTATTVSACAPPNDLNETDTSMEPAPTPTVLFEVAVVDTTATFTNRSLDADTYLWEFGDGETSNEPSPVHQYPDPTLGVDYDRWSVRLTGSGPGGESAATEEVAIAGPTQANFSFGPSGVKAFEEVVFDDTSINAEAWSWDFGDGLTSDERDPVHVYEAEGLYTVTLDVSGPGGDSSVTQEVGVAIPTPSAMFSYTPDARITAGETKVSFRNESTYGRSLTWDFGDGTKSTEENPTHTYKDPRQYLVTLTVDNESGSATTDEVISAKLPADTEIVVYEIVIDDLPWALSEVSPWTLPSSGTAIVDGTLDLRVYAASEVYFIDRFDTAGVYSELYAYNSQSLKTAKSEADFPQKMSLFQDNTDGGSLTLEFPVDDDYWYFHVFEYDASNGFNLLLQIATVDPRGDERAIQPYVDFNNVNALGFGSLTTTVNVDSAVDTGTKVTVKYRHKF